MIKIPQYSGTDLSGWSYVVGDAHYECSGELPPTAQDIMKNDYGTYSETWANVDPYIGPRKIMCHGMAVFKIWQDFFQYVHTLTYAVLLPYTPAEDPYAEKNPQTLEGGLALYDGLGSHGPAKQVYGIAWQWQLNPWSTNQMAFWEGNPAQWVQKFSMPADQSWHIIACAGKVVNGQISQGSISVDGTPYSTIGGILQKPDWGTDESAWVTAEAISCYPNCSIKGFKHVGNWKNWTWDTA